MAKTHKEDQYHDQQKIQAIHEHVFLKFAISASFFAFLICFISSISSGFFSNFFPKHFVCYFNTRLLSFLVQTLTRKYMFLICNAILAILSRTTASCTSNPTSSDPAPNSVSDSGSESSVHDHLPAPPFSLPKDEEFDETSAVGGDQPVEEGAEDEENGSVGIAEAHMVADSEDDDVEEQGYFCKEEEEEEEAGAEQAAEDLASTEEFNRRVEEFIRRMKEEIRIEADQPQLIAV